MIRLSGRLNELFNAIPSTDGTVVDIGCDHGKLIVAAVLSGKCAHGIGVDISKRSLSKAIEYADKCGAGDRVDFFEGDGFSPVNGKISCAIIAGLGGIEIAKILSAPHECDCYVLSPHQDAHFLRSYMRENGLLAQKDFVVYDKNKFYPIIVAVKGECDYSDEELFLGKNLPQSEDYTRRNDLRLEYIRKIRNNCEGSISDDLAKESEALEKWQKSRT